MTFRYTASVHRHHSTSCRCTCQPLVDAVANWMSSNWLQLNAIKTLMVHIKQLPTSPFRVCSDHVAPSTSVRDLGIYLDSDISMRSQVSTVSACFGVLRQLCSIHCSLPHLVVVVVIAHQFFFSHQRWYKKSKGGIQSRLQSLCYTNCRRVQTSTCWGLLSTFFWQQPNQPAIGSTTKRRLHQNLTRSFSLLLLHWCWQS